MKKKYKLLLILIAIIIVILLSIFLIPKLFKKEEETPIKVVDSINEYGYTLEDRDTKLMKDTYNELKSILNEDEVDMESYAKSLSKLFIIDLFTINNKRNKYDVGGVEYIYTDSQENFKINVEDTLYKTVKTNSDGKRKQDLPIVKSVNVGEVKKDEFTIGEDDTYDSYVIEITWDYEKDYGYDKKANITSIEKDGKMFIVEYTTGD